MTENNQNTPGESEETARNRWAEEVQAALDRTGDAIRSAWDATRESRMSALESAKQAASELSEVLDKGISAAKERWAATDQQTPDLTPDPAPTEEATPVDGVDEPTPSAGSPGQT